MHSLLHRVAAWLVIAIRLLAPYFSGLVALFIALCSDWLRGVLKRASVTVATRVPVESKLQSTEANIRVMRTSYLYHLKVATRWKLPLVHCRLNLLGMRRMEKGGGFVDLPLPVPHQFSWSPRYEHDQGSAVNVNHSRPVDFMRLVSPGTLDEKHRRVVPMLYHFPPNFDGHVYAGQTIRYSVQVEADGFASRVFEFQVSWDGNWIERNPAEMAKHFTIHKV